MSSFITEHGPTVQHDSHKKQGNKLHDQVIESASFQIDHTCHLYKIFQGIGYGDGLSPLGHTVDGGE